MDTRLVGIFRAPSEWNMVHECVCVFVPFSLSIDDRGRLGIALPGAHRLPWSICSRMSSAELNHLRVCLPILFDHSCRFPGLAFFLCLLTQVNNLLSGMHPDFQPEFAEITCVSNELALYSIQV